MLPDGQRGLCEAVFMLGPGWASAPWGLLHPGM